MKKLLAMVLALVMTLSLAVSANAAFKDADKVSDTYEEAVAVLNGMGVFKGYEDGSFQPQGDITRAEVAAIVYRVYTQDVKDAKASLYATYNKFSDMTGAGWAAGYIGYCANAELVKGYPNGTFQPSGKVTGYEVLAMILRAIGYDKNGEFSGADWALHVAQTAQQAHVLDNVKGVDLNAPATRELVAELLFRAIADAPMVTYTAAFGYQTVSFSGSKADSKLFKDNETLGHQNFKLTPKDDSDDWGRPATTWEYNVGDKSTTVVDKPDASFNVATTECDICAALGVKKSADVVEIYTNGVKKGTDTLTATETKAKLGAQGRQIEFYENKDGDYRMVVIDTYLAYVNEVVEKKVDSKDHTTRDAYLALDVYKTDDGKATTLYVKGNDYAEEDWVLVNVNDAKDVSIIRTTNKAAQESDLVEIAAKAESFEGVQSKIYYKADMHTIEGKDYDDAYRFYLNDAGKDGSVKYTWFLDQFGNVIGSSAIDNTNYAVLKDIEWVSGKGAHAQGTLVYMDGKEESVEIASIDGLTKAKGFSGNFDVNKDNATTEQGDTASDVAIVDGKKVAYVSTSDKYNEDYEGMALFMVETNKDGGVNLQGISTKTVGKETKLDDTYIEYAENVTIKAESTVMNVKSGATTTKYALTSNTQFIVRELNDKDEYVYNTYTLKTLPDYAENSVEAYFTVSDNDYVTRVYIKNATNESAFGTYIFMPEASKSNYWYDSADKAYYVNAYVDGELKAIEVAKEVGEKLAAGEGKLFEVKDGGWSKSLINSTYGVLTDAAKVVLVTEKTDVDTWTKNTKKADYITEYTLSANVLRSMSTLDSSALNVIDLDDAKIITWDGDEVTSITKAVLEDYGVWAVSKDTKYEGFATVIYLGNKLGDSADATVYVNDKTVKFEQTATPFSATVTGDLGAAAKVTAKAADKNAVVTIDNGENSFDTNHSATVTVVSEDGTAKNVYTVTLAPKATVAAAITKVKGVDVTANGVDTSNHPMYQVTLSTDLNSTYFTASDISYQGDNVKKVELVVLDKDGNIATVDGAPQIATDKVAATEINSEYWICTLITLDSGEHYAAWIEIVEGL